MDCVIANPIPNRVLVLSTNYESMLVIDESVKLNHD
jgi:hypothetical protein